ncbi:hypothetical protein DSM03_10289 [Leeuwenhoekiella aestuarii]|uniref:Adhesin n=1 Tax=Leeuwenhoekiella aestuarii TaxID=2249426 RepID=A0A4Q0NVV6_9FLAO|nr:hypothetical protein [Leeuwenhoekiella aestuarii]RXG15678.1 hypothetical protein DSM04_103567 [Leeuwenhoekiella aestuarii]RXG17213.1 hypothetical protein DSM03_10289 [Leeuwenhoekiella aestuarii]
MKINYYKTLLLFLVTSAVTFANGNDPDRFKGRYTKEKKITKEYNVNSDALLKINNSYGNVDVISWEQNKVVIEVIVKTNGNDEDKVMEKLNEIEVKFDASADMVSARTEIEEGRSSWWSSWTSSNNNVNMEINYKIKVPVTNKVDLSNDYGGISIDKIKGVAKISCDYGHLDLGELLADNNVLSFDYTNNSNITYMKSGKISADYSSFTLEKAENVVLNADYTKSNFGTVKNLKFSCDYGGVSLDAANNIEGSSDYLSVKLGKVSGNLDLNMDYGSLRIDELTANAGNVRINTEYAGVKVGYNAAYKFNFIIKLDYASLKGEEEFEITKRQIESSDKYYEGYYGSASAKNNLSINSEYGGVSFYKVN